MLIQRAEVWRGKGLLDVRIAKDRIAEIGALEAQEGEQILNARGGALLPGLHDHHIHLAALAAKNSSVCCGPPDVTTPEDLAARLSQPGEGWLRGVGYHESVAGMLTAETLDRLAFARPVRVQHRSGRMWFLNSAALDALLNAAEPPPGLERLNGRYTGRLFDEDAWLRDALAGAPPSFAAISAELASCGVTGVTDMSPSNDAAIASHIAVEQRRGALLQRCRLAGTLDLADGEFRDRLTLGPAKLHLHEWSLPVATACDFVRVAHEQARAVAIHCTTESELVFALATVAEAGALPGDRIEHASVAPNHLIAEMARLGLGVAAQPHFIVERGDHYLAAIDAQDLPHLYRLRAFANAGIALAGGSDAPFGSSDPFAAMAAAVTRRTRAGAAFGLREALSPEEAMRLFLADPGDLSRERRIEVGAAADLCLLDRPWVEARSRLSSGDVRASLVAGGVVYDRIDEAPFPRRSGADALAG